MNIVRLHPKDQTRIHQIGKKVLLGILLGYELIAGGIWKGDILIADMEDLEKVDAQIFILDDEFKFPLADGTAKLSGRDYEFRVPT